MRLGSHRGYLSAAFVCLALGLGAGVAAQQAAQSPQHAAGGQAASPDSAMAQMPKHQQIMGLGKLAAAAQIAQGKELFETSCSFCHGADARGGIGPDLLESPVVLDDVNGNKISKIVGKGFPPHMPSFQFNGKQVRALAAFLHSRVLEVANLAHGQYKLPFTVTGNAAAGEAYFQATCASCHSVTGDLKDIGGKYTPLQIQNMVLTGFNARSYYSRKRPKENITVTLPSGQTFTGRLRYMDEFNVVWVGPQGTVHSVRRGPGVHVVAPNPLAAHQKLLAKYTDADIHNLTAYLVSLK